MLTVEQMIAERLRNKHGRLMSVDMIKDVLRSSGAYDKIRNDALGEAADLCDDEADESGDGDYKTACKVLSEAIRRDLMEENKSDSTPESP
ncbi:hypothetical protein V6767_20420 [Martelella sp. FLE1502]